MYFEFGVHITEDPLGRMRLPDKFTEFLAAEVHLREASCSVCGWPVA
jgi:hypothetical protein